MNAFEIDGNGVLWRGDGETLSVQAWGADAVRVRARLHAEVLDRDWALLPPPDVVAHVEVHDTGATVQVGRLRALLVETAEWDVKLGHDVYRCHLTFENSAGDLLLRERDKGGSLDLRAREFRPHPRGGVGLTMSFDSEPEHLWGMGQYQDGIADLKGASLELAHRNSQASVPFLMSSRGYGFLWHNPAIGQVTFASNVTQWSAQSCEQLDYWITAGDTPAQLSRAYADATGHAPMMPERGLGFWQSKLRYWSQEQLLEVAREHVGRGLPMDVIVADFFHWPKMGDFRFEQEFWPDPRAMVSELDALGVQLMVSVWPQIAHDSENFAALRRHGLLVHADRGPDVHMSFEGPSAFLDVTNPRARQFLWERCKVNYFDHGIRTFWLDEAEPEYGRYDFDNYRYHAGPNAQVGNIYPQHFARAFYEGQRGEGQPDIVNLARCAWAGSQRFGALVWSGDIHSTWTDLRTQVVAGIHMGVAGIPWWTTDIGGFHDGHVDDPGFHELFVRWFQFGAFCPVMRLHGDRRPAHPVAAADGSRRLPSGADNEVWSFGEHVYGICAKYLELRRLLRDYVRETMRHAHADGQPVLRGLFHEFPADPHAWTVGDEYLFGADLLVAPVLEPGTSRRSVYLPIGASWTHLHDGSCYAGGQTVTVAAPLDSIPVFARGDALAEFVGKV